MIENPYYTEKKESARVLNHFYESELLKYNLIPMIEKGDTGLSMCRDIEALGVDILPVTRDDMNRAFDLYERYKTKGLPPRDLVHASVMINNGMSHIISSDKHFDSIREIKRVGPEHFVRSQGAS